MISPRAITPHPTLPTDLGTLAARAGMAYFVGGCVRDALLGSPSHDFDLVVAGSPWKVGKAMRSAYGGHLFWLREADQVARLLLPEYGMQVDLCLLAAEGIEADLRARDLTLNALAVSTAHWPPAGATIEDTVIDPTGGRQDLQRGLIRFVDASAPERDPLRTLRAMRFRWRLGFEYAPGTLERAQECIPLLARVSGERIRDELFHLLAAPVPHLPLTEVMAAGAGPFLTGGQVLPYDLCPPAVARVEARLDAAEPDLAALLASEPNSGRRRREVLMWAAALQALGPSLDVAGACRALALSNDEKQIIARGLAHASAAGELAGRVSTGRERYLFCQRAGRGAPEAVLLSPGVWSPSSRSLLAEVLRRHLSPDEPLLTGDDVAAALQLRPGPAIGRALAAVEEARADGLLTTREEALAFLLRRRAGEPSSS